MSIINKFVLMVFHGLSPPAPVRKRKTVWESLILEWASLLNSDLVSSQQNKKQRNRSIALIIQTSVFQEPDRILSEGAPALGAGGGAGVDSKQ